MATLSSLPQAFLSQWSQRPKSRTEIPAISTHRSPAHLKALPTAAPNFSSDHHHHHQNFQKRNSLLMPAFLSPIYSIRLGNVRNSHRLRGLHIVSASNTNPSKQDAPREKGDGGAQGPPLLTIVAGVMVFLLICWVVGSIVMWLIGLIAGPSS